MKGITHRIIPVFLIFVSLFMISSVFAKPIITPTHPTMNETNTSNPWVYVNISVDEDINESYVRWFNISSGSFANLSMSNSTAQIWYINISNTTGHNITLTEMVYNYTILTRNNTAHWNFSWIKNITVDVSWPSELEILVANFTYPNQTWYNYSYALINFSFTEANPQLCWVGWNNGTEYNVSGYINTSTDNFCNCVVNVTGVPDQANRTDQYGNVVDQWTYKLFVADGDNKTTESGVYHTGMDTTAPVFSTTSITQHNTSSETQINISILLTENNTHTIWAEVFREDNTSYTSIVSINNSNKSFQSVTWALNITSTQVNQDGDVIVRFNANDTAGNSVIRSNVSLLATMLKTGWNFITLSDTSNATAATTLNRDFVYELPTVTIVSVFNNTGYLNVSNATHGYCKNYTTYTRSAPTVNNDTDLTTGRAAWVYSSSNALYLRYNNLSNASDTTALENILIYPYNTSNYTGFGGWNAVGLFKDRTMNQILYANANFSYVSWYNATSNYYRTCYRGWVYCTGGGGGQNVSNVTTINLPKSSAIWIYSNGKMSFNRSAY